MEEEQTIIQRAASFVKAEPVFSVALVAALVSMIFVPPNEGYAEYIKWRTLGLLTMFMLCVAGLKKAGAFDFLANSLLGKLAPREKTHHDLRPVMVALVALPYFFAMFITNDVSLLTFVPFAIMVLDHQGRRDLIPLTLVLQTIAANAGSYLTPFGNPHNLYAYTNYDVSFVDFILAQAPFTIGLGVLLLLSIFLFGGAKGAANTGVGGSAAGNAAQPEEAQPKGVDKTTAVIFVLLFALSVVAVLKIVPVRYALLVVLFAVVIYDKSLLSQVDWLLLGTFVCFFIFSSNLANIPAISEVLSGAMAEQPFWITLGASQVISNVPSCTLLAPFTMDWRALAVGANLGGLGSPVGSLASLITIGFYRRQCNQAGDKSFGGFMKLFLALNFAFLAVCCIIWVLL